MYAIDSEHGQELCNGLQTYELALRAAQNHANRLQAPVYLYEAGSDGDAEEVAPETNDCEGREGGFPGHDEDA